MGNMKFDMSDLNEKGYIIIQAGRYPGKLTEWVAYKKEETGNTVNALTFEIFDGEYEGQNIRHFVVVEPGHLMRSKQRMFRTLVALGVIKPEDRSGEDGLTVSSIVDEVNDDKQDVITSFEVNGEKRKVIGCPVTLVVVEDTNQDGDPTHKIRHLEDISALGESVKDDDIPF